MDIQTETRALRRLATALTTDSASADDLVQDTWVNALRSPPKHDGPPRPWLSTILRNRRISDHRSKTRRERYEARAHAESGEPTPSDSAERIELTRQLLEHVAALPKEDQELLALRYWEGLTPAECSERLGRPASTIRTKLQRSLARLRTRLDRHAGGRDAWLAGLLPLVERPGAADHSPATSTITPEATPAAPMFSLTSISLGGVVAATVIWLSLAAHQGCGVEAESVTPDEDLYAAEALPVDDVPSHGAQATSAPPRAEAPQGSAARTKRRRLDEAHPCDIVEPEDSPMYAAIIAEGRRPTDEERKLSYLECIRRHPRESYRAHEGASGGVHPQFAVTMALPIAWAEARECLTKDETSSLRVDLDVFVDATGDISFEKVAFRDVEKASKDELDCIRQTVLAVEPVIRKGDATLAGFEPNTAVSYGLTLGLTLSRDDSVVYAAGEVPSRGVALRDREAFHAGVAECTSSPIRLILTHGPEDGRLLDVEPAAGADPEAAQCMADLLFESSKPQSRFFPREPEQAKFECRFGIDESYIRVSDGATRHRRFHCEHMGPQHIGVLRAVDMGG